MEKSKKDIRIQTKDGKRYGLFGASGCGKTTKARELIGKCNRIIIFDPKNEWATHRQWVKFATLCHEVEVLKSVVKRKWQKGFKIIFCPTFGNEIKELSQICNFVYQMQTGYGIEHNAKITVLIDEAQEGVPAGIGQTMPSHGARRLANMGRARGINLIVASQRIKTVDISIRANLDGIFIFRLGDITDVAEANRVLMGKCDILSLANYEYFYKDESGRIKKFKKS